MTMLERLQEKLKVCDVYVTCEQMAEQGASAEAIKEILRIACKFYGRNEVLTWLNNNQKLLAYLQR